MAGGQGGGESESVELARDFENCRGLRSILLEQPRVIKDRASSCYSDLFADISKVSTRNYNAIIM